MSDQQLTQDIGQTLIATLIFSAFLFPKLHGKCLYLLARIGILF